jgi:hypothetical protein
MGADYGGVFLSIPQLWKKEWRFLFYVMLLSKGILVIRKEGNKATYDWYL